MPANPVLWAFLACLAVGLIAFLGGVGGTRHSARAALRQVMREGKRELDEIAADYVGLDLRVKKLEGRAVRAQEKRGAPDELAAALATLRAAGAAPSGPRAVPAEGEQEAAVLARAFPSGVVKR